MVEAALRDEPRFEPSRIEVDRSGPSYMADTLDEVALQHPDSKLFLIVGYDSLIDLPNWRAPERIMGHAHLLVLPRPGDMNRTPAALQGHYDMLQFEMTSLSSTVVRERIARGESIDNLVPQPVAALIKAKGLYHDNP